MRMPKLYCRMKVCSASRRFSRNASGTYIGCLASTKMVPVELLVQRKPANRKQQKRRVNPVFLESVLVVPSNGRWQPVGAARKPGTAATATTLAAARHLSVNLRLD